MRAEVHAALSVLFEVDRTGRTVLTEVESRWVLECFDLPLNRWEFVVDADAAARAARTIGYPVVLKVVSPDILHKSDVGGVVLDVADERQLRDAYTGIEQSVRRNTPSAVIQGIAVAERIRGLCEVLVGVKRDPVFGPTCVVGLGGIWTELLGDVALRVCPLTDEDVLAMLAELRGSRLLRGYRGVPECDVEALRGLVMKVSEMAICLDAIAELDLNPVVVGAVGEGAWIVDARMASTPASQRHAFS